MNFISCEKFAESSNRSLVSQGSLSLSKTFLLKATNKASCKEYSLHSYQRDLQFDGFIFQESSLKLFMHHQVNLNCKLSLWSSSISFYCLCLLKLSDIFFIKTQWVPVRMTLNQQSGLNLSRSLHIYCKCYSFLQECQFVSLN